MKKRILATFMTVALLTAAFSGTALAWDGWDIVDGNWCYYQNDQIVTGWLAMNGTWYYMDPVSGAVQTGWVYVDGSWYYMDDSGAMLTGWQNVNGTWYYMYDSGAMATGWVYVDGAWYYMYDSGAMATGWVYVDGIWYYMYDSGVMATGWLQIIVDRVETPDGQMVEISNWYYLDNSGAMVTGWLYSGGRWYYMGSSGAMETGWVYNGGNWYFLTPEVGMLEDAWLTTMVEGIKSEEYYLKPGGVMACNETLNIHGETYTFSASGAATKIPNAMQVSINTAAENCRLMAGNEGDLSTYAEEYLGRLPNVDKTLAMNIAKYLIANGKLTDINQLLNVEGMTQAIFDGLKGYVTLN